MVIQCGPVTNYPNPEADPYCNGLNFHNCTRLMEDVKSCQPNGSYWLECFQREMTDVKLMDCNDQQRKSAKRLLEIYTETDVKVCSNNSKVLKGTNETICWEAIRERAVNDLFGHGTQPCLITEWSKNKTIAYLEAYCNPKEAKEFYFDIRKLAGCKDDAVGLVFNFATLLIVALPSLLTNALWQR